MSINNHFALNHILSPNLKLKDFFVLSNNMNIQNIEIRNDLPKVSLKTIEPNMIKELEKMLSKIKGNETILVTTEKDYFRIAEKYKKNIKCLKIEIEIENKDQFVNEIKRII